MENSRLKNLNHPAVRAAIASRLANLTPNDSALWGKMSPHQMLCHLNDAYLVPLGRRVISELRPPLPLPPSWFKWIALRAPVQWRPGVPTPPEIAQDQGGTRPTQFEQDRATLQATLDEFCTNLPEPCPPHPFFGQMAAEDWMRWGYLHADHHLRQFGR